MMLVWARAPMVMVRRRSSRVVVWQYGSAGEDVVGSVYAAAHAALEVLQSWLAGIGRARWWC